MVGYLTVIIYCLALSSSAVLIQEGSTDNGLVVLAGSLLGILFYGMISYKKLGKLIKKLKNNSKYVIGANIATTGAWLCGYLYGLEYIDAPTLFCIEMAAIPIVSFVASTALKEYPKHIPNLIAILCSVVSMCLIIRQNILLGGEVKSYLVGSCMGVLAGIGTVYTGIFSENLSKNHFSSSEILMSRLLLLLPISLFINFKRGSFMHLTFASGKLILMPSFMAGIFNSFLYQKALQKLGVVIVSTLIPFTPVCAYFMRMYLGKQPFNLYVFLGILLCSAIICSMNILMKRNKE